MNTYYFTLTVLISVLVSCHGEAVSRCLRRRFPYYIADSEQCDKFYKCENSQLTENLCPDGLAFEPESQSCFIYQRVNCKSRPKLQPARSNLHCPRQNGRFPLADSCFTYHECDRGFAIKVTCPTGLIFDDERAVCDFPDMANRTGCQAEEILGFRCPHSYSPDVVLPFGDHERFPKVSDCRHFFMCLRSGKPREGGCPFGFVYNPSSLHCDKPHNVPGCEGYYTHQDDRR